MDVTIRLRSQQPALQHTLGQFLDEQRHAVGAFGDLVDDDPGAPSGDLRDSEIRSRRSRRFNASIVTPGWPVQGG